MDELRENRLRREQERERRRLRDRERRQSMSVEERERHLARRRRNYQIRRQKAENVQFDTPNQLPATLGTLTANQEQETVIFGSKNQESLDIPDHQLAKLSGRLRLSRLKLLARTSDESCNDSNAEAESTRITAGLLLKIKEMSDFSDAISDHEVRLNKIKRLARRLSSTDEKVHETGGSELCPNETKD